MSKNIKNDGARTQVFTTDKINELIEREADGEILKFSDTPWFKKMPGIRKPNVVFDLSPEELEEYTRCKLDVHYFANKYCHIKREDGTIGQMKLRDYQKDILDLYYNNRFSILMASRQTGKAQPLDATVWTVEGKTQFGNLKIGDKIYDEKGQLTDVVGVYPQGIKDIYEVEFSDGSKVRTCGEHLWGVEDVAGKYQVVELQDLISKGILSNRGDYKWFVKATEPVQYQEQELPMEPYLLGLLIGDGAISNQSVNIATVDREIVDYIKTFENYYLKIVQTSYCSYRFSKQHRNGHPMKDVLTELGLMGKRSHEKFIPKKYLYSSVEQRLEILRGLMDTDGSVSKKGIIEFSTSSKLLADDVSELCESLGIIVRRTEKDTFYKNENGLKVHCKTAYRLKLQLRNNYPHEIFKLKRKQELINTNKKYDWGRRRGIASVKFVGREHAQCIEVNNESHLYLTDHYIPTHNTISAAILMLHFITFNYDKGVMIVANKGDTVIEILDKIKNIYKLLPYFLKVGIVNWGQKQLVFDNGCRIKTAARSKEPSIGFTIDLLYMDEFAHVPKNIIGPYYRAVVPTVSSMKNSKIIITSTPNGYNLFYDLIQGAMAPKGDPKKNPYEFLKVMWYQVPGRLDTKMYLDDEQLERMKVSRDDIFKTLKDLGAVEYKNVDAAHAGKQLGYYIQSEDPGNGNLVDVLCIKYMEDFKIEDFKKIRINGVPVFDLGDITTWEERETKLIGSKENFDQEYNLHFLSGSKRLFEPEVLSLMNSRMIEYESVNFDTLNKLWFETKELLWATKSTYFNLNDIKNGYYFLSVDTAEGIGEDGTAITVWRLCPKVEDELRRTVIKTIQDCFKLEQVAKYNYNKVTIPEAAHLLYILAFEILDPAKLQIILELNAYGRELYAEMPKVFNNQNSYGNYVFARFKHRADDDLPKPGLKIGTNKNMFVREFQEGIKKCDIIPSEKETLIQLNNFIKHSTPSGKTTYKAETGHDDLAMCCVFGNLAKRTVHYKGFIDSMYKDLSHEEKLLIQLYMGESIYTEAHSSGELLRNVRNTGRSGGRFNTRRVINRR